MSEQDLEFGFESDDEMDAALNNMHFYASSVQTWATTKPGRDLHDLLKYMDSEKMSYSLYLVPVPWNTGYKISRYAPQVDGAKEIAFFRYANGRKVKDKAANVLSKPIV